MIAPLTFKTLLLTHLLQKNGLGDVAKRLTHDEVLGKLNGATLRDTLIRENSGLKETLWEQWNFLPTWQTCAERLPAEAPPPLVGLDIDSYLAAKFPPRELLLKMAGGDTRLLTSQSLNQLFAWRGTGKSMLAQEIALTLAAKGKFLAWEAPRPVRVLYVEGEMPDEQVQERFHQLKGKRKIAPGFLRVFTMGQQADGIPSIATAAGQRALEDALGDAEVLILDSISTLAWISTNDEENWIELLHWLNRLRNRKKLCIIFLHHAGKSGAQRGHSRCEDMLDLSLKLERDAADETEHCKFRLTYDKVRGARAGIRNLDVEYCAGEWTFKTVEAERLMILREYLDDNQGASARKILKDLGTELGVTSHPPILKLMKKVAADRKAGVKYDQPSLGKQL